MRCAGTGADKVHEWDFSCDARAMARLETPKWRELEKQQNVLRRKQRRLQGTGEPYRDVLEKRTVLLEKMAKEAPLPTMKYSKLLSQCDTGKHVVIVRKDGTNVHKDQP